MVNELLILDLKEGLDRNNVTVRKLARIALALKKCASQLEEECKKIPQRSSSTTPHRSSSTTLHQQLFFPQPTSQPPSSTPRLPTNVIYSKRLGPAGCSFMPNELQPKDMRSLFTGMQDHKEVVVKFTAMYNKEAHTLLAKNGYAPKLYSCDRVIGDLFMVVMERLQGKPLASVKPLVHHSAFVDITRALDVLREKKFVHGDLRAVNVMIVREDQKQDHAKLIDFDWAGKSGIAQYPWTINKAALSHEWDPDVEAGGLMKTAHDKFALDLLKPRFMPSRK